MKRAFAAAIIAGIVLGSSLSSAGVPFTNLEGVGGVAFNPLAYPAGTRQEGRVFAGPQVGLWYVNLGEVSVDWTAIGFAETLFGRVEISYGYETIAPEGKNVHKSSVGAKLLLLEENLGGRKFVPAVALGTIWKTASGTPPGVDSSGFDYYAVATKLVTEAPKPILLSAGVLSTEGRVTGVFGFDEDRKQTLFANIDFLPRPNVAVGFE